MDITTVIREMSFMKRICVCLFLGALVLTVFSACGNTEPEMTEATTEVTTEATTAATTEVTTEATTEATTEGTTAGTTTAETSAKVMPQVDFEAVWAEGIDDIINVRLVDFTLPYERNGGVLFETELYYVFRGEEKGKALLESLSVPLSKPLEEYSSHDAWWETRDPDLGLRLSREYSFFFALSGETDLLPLCYCATEEGNYAFRLEGEPLELLESFIEDARIRSFSTCLPNDIVPANDSAEPLWLRVVTTSVENYGCETVTDLEYTLTSHSAALGDRFEAIFDRAELSPDQNWYRTVRNLSVELPDGRAAHLSCDYGPEGCEVSELIYFTENGENIVFSLDEEARDGLEELLDKILIHSAEN